jgi:hypothetical protein
MPSLVEVNRKERRQKYSKMYKEKNKEQIKKYRKEYYEETKDRQSEYYKKYYLENIEQYKMRYTNKEFQQDYIPHFY